MKTNTPKTPDLILYIFYCLLKSLHQPKERTVQMKEYLSEDKHNSEASCTQERKKKKCLIWIKTDQGKRENTMEEKKNHLTCIEIVHTTTNRPLLAEPTVLPLSSIALWCRVALYLDCPVQFHSPFWKKEKTTSQYTIWIIHLLDTLSNFVGNMAGSHSWQQELKKSGGKYTRKVCRQQDAVTW